MEKNKELKRKTVEIDDPNLMDIRRRCLELVINRSASGTQASEILKEVNKYVDFVIGANVEENEIDEIKT